MKTVEGYLFDVEPVISKSDYRFRLALRHPNGNVYFVDDRSNFEFWLSSSYQGLVDVLEKNGINYEIRQKNTPEGERELYEVVTDNPGFGPSEIERLLATYPVKLIGTDRERVFSYMFKRKLRPFDYIVASGHTENDVLVADEIRIERAPVLLKLKTLAFDFEVYNPLFPNPKEARFPIIVVSAYTREDDTYQIASRVEEENIRGFIDYVNRIDPDLLVSWNGNNFDLQYIQNRGEKLSIPITIGRNGNRIRKKHGGIEWAYDIPGRGHADMFLTLYRLWGFPSKSLDDASKVILGREPPKFDVTRLHEYWDSGNIEPILEYAMGDVIDTHDLAEILGIDEVAVILCQKTGIPIDKIFTFTPEKIAYLMAQRSAYGNNWILFDRKPPRAKAYNKMKDKVYHAEAYPGDDQVPKGHVIDTKRIHIANIARLNQEFQERNRGPIATVAEELLKEMENYRTRISSENGFTPEQMTYRFLREIGYYLPALVINEEYPWYDKRLRELIEESYKLKLQELQNSAVYIGWDRIITPALPLTTQDLDIEKANVPVLVSNKENHLYISNGIPITRGFKLKRRERSDFINNLMYEVVLESCERGVNGAIEVAQSGIRELRQLPPAELEFSGFIQRPISRYRRKTRMAKAAESMGVKPFEQLSFFLGETPEEITDETYSEYENFLIERLFPIFQAFGYSKKEFASIMKDDVDFEF